MIRNQKLVWLLKVLVDFIVDLIDLKLAALDHRRDEEEIEETDQRLTISSVNEASMAWQSRSEILNAHGTLQPRAEKACVGGDRRRVKRIDHSVNDSRFD